ncbi:MAG: response regulator transcription factor [Gemmatimonadetes bacterium]|uniref:Phosphate regulon transcriptional regulatory protein PhoB n=1 Tax=Candidatus Kutchimonas denitrificans TaxID=3056748 RepID=A0AAE4Z9E8_9BACT|nr:response regulator transcription factor [Gemmatimonadota bacterium]NIR75087.1 response regulator transcription factor [Candidatus Kutchimonas denitrificans]NIS00919.1 response regulator transcription factor [Gemmatimonadota bacterium]NIT66536.1 response regulator transcription factor [Gemmatimonadota bacterium]NIU52882.1 response regulator [Gemmatimonadota bacterium]
MIKETHSHRVLVVEDEPDIAALVAYQLAHAGYGVRTTVDGREALRAIETDPPDLVVLDLLLPEISGLDVLRVIRGSNETKDLPVVILTARGDEESRVAGLKLGADDYMAKPFSPRELVLRVEAVLRRSVAESNGSNRRARLRVGAIAIDTHAHSVTVDDRDVSLTRKEFRLLLCLMQRRGRTQSRRDLLEAVWDTTAPIETRTVDMHVRRLRAKLGEHAELIETVRGFGYRFR